MITSISRKWLSVVLVVFGTLSWNFKEPDKARLLDENLISFEINKENAFLGNPQLATVPLIRSHVLRNDNLFLLRRSSLSPAEKY